MPSRSASASTRSVTAASTTALPTESNTIRRSPSMVCSPQRRPTRARLSRPARPACPAGRYALSPTENASAVSTTRRASSSTPGPSSRLPAVSAPMASTSAVRLRSAAVSSGSRDGVAVRTRPAPAAASPGVSPTMTGRSRSAAASRARSGLRLHHRTSATSATCRSALTACRATGPAPITARVVRPGPPRRRAATAAMAAVRIAVMSAESSTARTVNRTGSNATISPAEDPASGRKFAFTARTAGSASAPALRCSAAPGTRSCSDPPARPGPGRSPPAPARRPRSARASAAARRPRIGTTTGQIRPQRLARAQSGPSLAEPPPNPAPMPGRRSVVDGLLSLGVVDVGLHRGARRRRVAGHDRVGDLLVLPAALQPLGGPEPDRGPARREVDVHLPDDLAQRLVAGGLGQQVMEVPVGVQELAERRLLALRLGDERAGLVGDRLALRDGGRRRHHLGRGALQDPPHTVEVAPEQLAAADGFERAHHQPGQHVPVGLLADHRALAVQHADHADRGQELQRLPNGQPADPVKLGELGFRGQERARGDRAARHLVQDERRHLLAEPRAAQAGPGRPEVGASTGERLAGNPGHRAAGPGWLTR